MHWLVICTCLCGLLVRFVACARLIIVSVIAARFKLRFITVCAHFMMSYNYMFVKSSLLRVITVCTFHIEVITVCVSFMLSVITVCARIILRVNTARASFIIESHYCVHVSC